MRARHGSFPARGIAALLAVTCTLTTGADGVGARTPAASFRVDAAHTGVYRGPAPRLDAVAWRRRMRGRVFGSATIAGGVAYVGDTSGTLVALRLTDGSLVWRARTRGGIASTPAVAAGRVFVVAADGLYALRARDGRVLWRHATPGERRHTASGFVMPARRVVPDPWDVFLSSPAVVDGVVYAGSGDGSVYALDARTGTLRWRFRTRDVVHTSPAVANGVVYAGSFDRSLYALDARTGALRWRFATLPNASPVLEGIASSAAVADGTVYVGARDGHLYALRASDGALRWRHDDRGSWVIASPAVMPRAVCFTTSDELRFFCLDRPNGATRSTFRYATYGFSSPAIAGRIAYFGTFDGILHAVDVRTGREVARFRTEASRRNAGRVLGPDGRIRADLYGDGSLAAVERALRQLFSLGAIVASPAIANGTLVVGTADGVVYALR